MKIAIVILNWNGEKLLQQFLPSVAQNSNDQASIYVVDNASTDGSINFLRSKYPQINIIQNAENFGFAKGYNVALKTIEADIYCLLNNDVEVTKNWLSPILKIFEEESNTSIIQPKILNFHNKHNFDYAGAAGGFIDKLGYPYCRGRIFNTIEEDQGQYNDSSEIFWASGACMFIRKSTYDELKGFDTSFFAHMEEIDLCWRSKNLGHKIKYCHNTSVYHVGGATLSDSNPEKTYLNFRNSLYALVKNASGNILALIVLRLILDGIAGIKFLVELKGNHTIAIVKAHFSFYANYSRLSKQRKSVTKLKNYYAKPSIVWSYFIRRKRTFQSL